MCYTKNMSASEILVVILSIFLAIFLVVGIIIGILIIKISLQIKKVAASAERAVEHAEQVTANFSKYSSQAFLAKLVKNQVTKFRRKNK